MVGAAIGSQTANQVNSPTQRSREIVPLCRVTMS
jgi:hypothetical protein